MTIPGDFEIVDPRVAAEIRTPEQAANFIEEKISIVREQILREPPPETARIDCREYTLWDRRLMILYGRAIGVLEFAQSSGFISVAQFKLLKNRIIGAVHRRSADVQMGVHLL